MNKLELTLADDLHIHLRDGAIMEYVVPLVRKGGSGRVLVMPNIKPIIQNTEQALAYKKKLQDVDSNIEYLMTLYLNESIDAEEVRKAKAAGIVGIKSYPKGVTTNSDAGSTGLKKFFHVFEEMEKQDLILNVHGEVPSDHNQNICVMNAEQKFLPQLIEVHKTFPKLRIVLEHVTSKDAVECIESLGDTVAATITAHHLEITVDEWAGQNHNYCKPVAKYPIDRDSLRRVVKEGNRKFFLGSDSAPHLKHAKETACACAGVFTSSHLMAYLANTFERLGCLEKLEAFTSIYGREFYKLPPLKEKITLLKKVNPLPNSFNIEKANDDLIPFLAGETLNWEVQ
jgi:dihydroorotase